MTEKVNVAIVGAGQAGLATSWYLTQAGVDHIVLEAGRVAETWRTRRWDSFCLVTPNWSVTLPGGEYAGGEPDGFMRRDAIVDHFERWVEGFNPPLRTSCHVTALDADERGFVIQTAGGPVRARSVVVATGAYQRAHLPPAAGSIPAGVTQVLAEDYRHPDGVDDGAVLIIGGGQSGCQIAEELHESGRRVLLSTGRAPWAPRRFGGHDLVWWLIETGWWQRTLRDLPPGPGRLLSNWLATGRGGGHDLHYRTLHAAGVELLGRYLGAEGSILRFDPNANEAFAAGDQMSAAFIKRIDDLCEQRGLDKPWSLPPPLQIDARGDVDVLREGIKTVIWTTGYRPAYEWIHMPLCDDMGFPVQVDGRSTVDGLYFMGVHFQRKAQSTTLYGVGEDAELVARHIIENRA